MEQFLALIANTADGVIAVNWEQQILVHNEAAAALFGFPANEVRGQFCYEVICGQDESGRKHCRRGCLDLVKALQQELVPTHNILVHTKDGREVWINVSTIVIPLGQHPCALVHLYREVTCEKELERFVQQLRVSLANLSSSGCANLPVNSPLAAPPSQGPDLATSTASASSPTDLSRREREVLHLLASGASTKAIARKLFISPATARNHIGNIFAKLEVHSRIEAVTLFLRNGSMVECSNGHRLRPDG